MTRASRTAYRLVICAWCRAELAAAVCRAYNRWLADYCKPYPDRLFGVAMLPMFLQR